ncbi:MAG: MBL fold metallo-hydrolase [Acidimicrobiia bacterium]|nr:MBL fold metallo-hydrolase [Acidimicrobiia bacterium]
MKIHVLGSGTPTPTPERFGSAFVAEVAEELVMIDCGPAATWKLAKVGIDPTAVDNLFFTHHHFDHDVDYPCFLLTRWDQSVGSENDLRAYGPAPTVRLTDQLIGPDGAFAHDYNARINWKTSQQVFVNRGGVLPRRPPVVQATDIEAGYVHETTNWSMRSAVAQHAQPYLDCLAYRLDTADGSVVFTGDTEPCDSVLQLAKGADTMLSMCWDMDEEMEASGEHQGQCGVSGAARMAAEAEVGRLVLVHTGPDISQPHGVESALERVSQIYDGEVVFADEFMQLELED